MLILTRKFGESITIGDDIKVTVLESQGKQIKLGIIAPKEVKIHREEIYEKIQDQNKEAAKVSRRELKEVAQMWRCRFEGLESVEKSTTEEDNS